MRISASGQGAKPEAKSRLLLRISQRSHGAERPFAARVLFFNGLLTSLVERGCSGRYVSSGSVAAPQADEPQAAEHPDHGDQPEVRHRRRGGRRVSTSETRAKEPSGTISTVGAEPCAAKVRPDRPAVRVLRAGSHATADIHGASELRFARLRDRDQQQARDSDRPHTPNDSRHSPPLLWSAQLILRPRKSASIAARCQRDG